MAFASRPDILVQGARRLSDCALLLTRRGTLASDAQQQPHPNAAPPQAHSTTGSHARELHHHQHHHHHHHQPHFVLPATQLSRSTGPAVWRVGSTSELAGALQTLLTDSLERRSRGYAAAQAAAKLASGLVNTVWHVLDDSVITPALHGFVQSNTPGAAGAPAPAGGAPGSGAAQQQSNRTA